MTKKASPGLDCNFDSLATETSKRHEELVDLFGQYVMWLRNWSLLSVQSLVESQEARDRLANILRKPFEEFAKLTQEDRKSGLQLSNAAVDGFIVTLLHVLAHQGNDFDLGTTHCIRYKLVMEIVDKETGDVVLEEVINRTGKRHFADYWGRWLNHHSDE